MKNSKKRHGIMVSSTFSDLKEHREIAKNLIIESGYFPDMMENDGARIIDVITSSLKKVHNSAIYMNVISKKYGTVYEDDICNPQKLSLTELEFDEAIRLNRPILLFVMGANHPILENDIELDATKREKLNAFREKAKKMNESSDVTRVYAEFNSIVDFEKELNKALRQLPDDLIPTTPKPKKELFQPKQRPICAIPEYRGSHPFIGRQEELNRLTEWASSDNQHPVFLFEAIGGMGKSMLTWEWVTNHAEKASNEWAGIFWYSFYEQGANLNDFCRYALAYITLPQNNFSKIKSGLVLTNQVIKQAELLKTKNFDELSSTLLQHLSEKPWLFVLDGLERLLMCYHRYDATDVSDDIFGETDDNTSNLCIRPLDDIFLSELTKVSSSKILITSRLKPTKFINHRTYTLLQGIDYCMLTGFNNNDAFDFFSACEIRGTRENIQRYLNVQCDNHPLVIGALAGIIRQYVPDRGNFDKWHDDEDGAGKLNLAQLDLTQRKNHIVKYSIEVLPPICKELISYLSFFSQGINYDAFYNFYVNSKSLDAVQNTHSLKKVFNKAINTLEEQGLLQRKDQITFDLHPVIRSVTIDLLSDAEKKETAIPVIDYFNKNSIIIDIKSVENIQEISSMLSAIFTLFKIGEFEKVMELDIMSLLSTLSRMEAHKEIIEVTNPLIGFILGNSISSTILDNRILSIMLEKSIFYIMLENSTFYTMLENSTFYTMLENSTFSLQKNFIITENIQAKRWINNYEVNSKSLKNQINSWLDNVICSRNISSDNLFNITLFLHEYEILCLDLNKYASAERAITYYQKIIELIKSEEDADMQATLSDKITIKKMSYNNNIGNYEAINEIYNQCDNKDFYIRYQYNRSLLRQNILPEDDAESFLQEAKEKKENYFVRKILGLQGRFYYDNKNYEKAFEKLYQAVEMSRDTNSFFDDFDESLLLLTQFRLKKLSDPHKEVENLASKLTGFHSLYIAELWWELGEETKARQYAAKQYRHSWGEGEPYSDSYWLNKTRDFMIAHNIDIPKLPIYEPDKIQKESWEEPLLQLLEKRELFEEAKKLADFSACKTLVEKEENLSAVKKMIEENPDLQELHVIYSVMFTNMISEYETLSEKQNDINVLKNKIIENRDYIINYGEVLYYFLAKYENIQTQSNLREKIISKYKFSETHIDELLTSLYINQCIKTLSQIGYKCYHKITINNEIIHFIAIADNDNEEILVVGDVIINDLESENYDNKLIDSINKLNVTHRSMQAYNEIFLDENIKMTFSPLIITPKAITINDKSIESKILESDIKLVNLEEGNSNYILNHIQKQPDIKDQEYIEAFQEYIETAIDYFKKSNSNY